MHHQVGVGDDFVNFSDAADRQHFTRGLARELVSTMARADGDGQSLPHPQAARGFRTKYSLDSLLGLFAACVV